MNNVVNKFLLASDKFMPEMFVEMNSIKLVFNTILLMQIIKI